MLSKNKIFFVFIIFLVHLSSCKNLYIASDDEFENDFISAETSQNEESNYFESHNNRLFKELENYESYRPDSSSDTTRNPFNKNKRYIFGKEKI